jgi:hypothetical protein
MKFISYINGQGEVLGTNALGQGIRTELTANSSEATFGQTVSKAVLKTLFGTFPLGEKNLLAKGTVNTKSFSTLSSGSSSDDSHKNESVETIDNASEKNSGNTKKPGK